MKSIKEKSKEWCSQNSNKKCKGPCDGCWVIKTPWGCEQHNMEKAFVKGANYVLGEILDKTSQCITIEDAYEALFECVKQLKK